MVINERVMTPVRGTLRKAWDKSKPMVDILLEIRTTEHIKYTAHVELEEPVSQRAIEFKVTSNRAIKDYMKMMNRVSKLNVTWRSPLT